MQLLKNKGFSPEIIKIADNSASDSDCDLKIEASFVTKNEKGIEISKLSEETTSLQEEKTPKLHDFSAQRIIEQCFNRKASDKQPIPKKNKEKKEQKNKELKEKANNFDEKKSADLEIIEIKDENKPVRRKKIIENYKILDNGGAALLSKTAKKRKLKRDKDIFNEEDNKKKVIKVQDNKKVVIFPAKVEKIKKKNLFNRTVFLNNENLLIEKKKNHVSSIKKEKNTSKNKPKEQKNNLNSNLNSKKDNHIEEVKEKSDKKCKDFKEQKGKKGNNAKNTEKSPIKLRRSSRNLMVDNDLAVIKRSKTTNPRQSLKKTNKSNIPRNKSVNTIEIPHLEEPETSPNALNLSATNLKLTDSFVFDVEKKQKKQKSTKNPIVIPDNSSEER